MELRIMTGTELIDTQAFDTKASHKKAVQGEKHYSTVVNSYLMQIGVAAEEIDWSDWPVVTAYLESGVSVSVSTMTDELEMMRTQEERTNMAILAKDLDTKKGSRALLAEMDIIVSDEQYKVWRTNTLIEAARAVASAYEDAEVDAQDAAFKAYAKAMAAILPEPELKEGEENMGTMYDSKTGEVTPVVGTILTDDMDLNKVLGIEEEEPAPVPTECKAIMRDNHLVVVNNKGKDLICDTTIVDDIITRQRQATMIRTEKLKIAAHDLKAYGLMFAEDGHIVHVNHTHVASISTVENTITDQAVEETAAVEYNKTVIKTPRGSILFSRWTDKDGTIQIEVNKKMKDLALQKYAGTHKETTCTCGAELIPANQKFTRQLIPIHPLFKDHAYCNKCQQHIVLTGLPRSSQDVKVPGKVHFSFTTV